MNCIYYIVRCISYINSQLPNYMIYVNPIAYIGVWVVAYTLIYVIDIYYIDSMYNISSIKVGYDKTYR